MFLDYIFNDEYYVFDLIKNLSKNCKMNKIDMITYAIYFNSQHLKPYIDVLDDKDDNKQYLNDIKEMEKDFHLDNTITSYQRKDLKMTYAKLLTKEIMRAFYVEKGMTPHTKTIDKMIEESNVNLS